MTKTRKRFVLLLITALVAFVAAALVLITEPASHSRVAYAEDDVVQTDEAATTIVTTPKELVGAINTAQEGATTTLGGNITLDLTVDNFITQGLPDGHLDIVKGTHNNQTIDLNGYTLEITTGSTNCCIDIDGVTLTIIDSSEEGTGTVKGTSNGTFATCDSASTLNLKNVTVVFENKSDDASTAPAISYDGALNLNNVDFELTHAIPVYSSTGGTITYETLQDEINAAPDGTATTVTLAENKTESITIPEGKNITLDLAGHTLTNAEGNHTITNYGTLTIQDSGTSGTVNNTTDKIHTVVNYGTATIISGKFTHENVGDGSGYVIKNYGYMVIGENAESKVTVTSEAVGSSLVASGYQNISEKTANENLITVTENTLTLVINGGTFSGGLIAVKNDDLGTTTINDGTFTNSGNWTVQNAGALTIKGGTFVQEESVSGNYVVHFSRPAADYGAEALAVTTTITGGNFSGDFYSTSDTSLSVAVSGGSFNEPFKGAYIAEGASLYKTADTTYPYTVYEEGDSIPAGAEKVVAMVGSSGTKTYATLQDALKDTSSTYVYLLSDTSENVTVSRDVQLDLNGYTLTAADTSSPAITVSASLSLTGNFGGTIDDVAVGKDGAFYCNDEKLDLVVNGDITVNAGGAATISYGTFNGTITNNGGEVSLKGGTYSEAPAQELIASEYGITDNGDGTFSIDIAFAQLSYIVEGETFTANYATWDDALSALDEIKADSGTAITIKIFDEVSVGSKDFNVKSGQIIILDLNAKDFYPDITNSGNLTVEGSYTGTRYVYGDITNNAGGELTIAGGRYDSGVTITNVPGATLEVTGGRFHGGDLARFISQYLADGSCFIQGASSPSLDVDNAETLVTVTDGTYTLNFSTLKSANFYASYASQAENTIVINVLDDISTDYQTFAGSSSVQGSTEWTIDLGGHTMTITSAYGHIVGRSGAKAMTVTICNGTITNERITSGRYLLRAAYGSTLTLENITVEYTGSNSPYLAGVLNSGSTLKISSGNYFSGNIYVNPDNNNTVSITGGTFGTTLNTDYIAEGYAQTESGTVVQGSANSVAMVNGVGYSTLQAAIDAAGSSDTIILLASINESVTIGSGQTIVLDLGGFTLTNESGSHTITNNGTLTIVDTSEAGTGTVDNVSNGCAAILNNAGSTAYLYGGTYARSAEAGTDGDTSGGNSYYVIDNKGTMVIGESNVSNVKVCFPEGVGYYSSLIENGWLTPSQNTTKATASLTINGGTFVSGKYTVKNDDYGETTISDGTFSGALEYAVLNWNKLTIEGGTFSGTNGAVYTQGDDSLGYEAADVTITGGDINGQVWAYGASASVNISGGNISDTQYGVVALANADVTISGENTEISGEYAIIANGADTTVTIENGSFNGRLFTQNAEGMNVSNGTFSVAFPASYLAENSALAAGEDGKFVVVEAADETYVAEVASADGSTVVRYSTLQAAINAAESGATVTLLEDIGEEGDETSGTDSSYITLNANKSITLDLGGHTVYSGAESAFIVIFNGTLTVKNGTIKVYYDVFDVLPYADYGYKATLILEDTLTAQSQTGSAVFITPVNNYDYDGEAIAVLETSANLISLNAGITDPQYCSATIQGNGERHGTSITINGGSVINANDTAIYHPQYGTLTITGDAVITGGRTGVEMRAGTLNISGNVKITGNGDPFTADPNGNGSTTVGAAVGVVQHTTKLSLQVNISGGTLTGARAVYQANLQNNSAEYIAKISISLSGGIYNGEVYSENLSEFITGGSFSSRPAEDLFAEGYTGAYYGATGYYEVIESTSSDLAALLAAQADAMADVRVYAASLGIDWSELVIGAEDEEADNHTEASVVINLYNAIGEAESEYAVAQARLAAMEAVELYASFNNSALEEAKINAKADIIEYAATLGLKWSEITESDDEWLVASVTAYNSIDSAQSVEEVAQLRLDIMQGLEAYAASVEASLDSLKAQAIEALDTAATAAGNITIPTNLYLAIYSATNEQELALYRDNGVKEIAAIGKYLTEISEQTTDLENLLTDLEALDGALFGTEGSDGQQSQGAIADIEEAIEQAQQAITGVEEGDGNSQSLKDIYDYLSGTINNTLGTISGNVATIVTNTSGLQEAIAKINALDENLTLDNISQKLNAAVDAIMGATEGEGGKSIAEAVTEINSATQEAVRALAEELLGTYDEETQSYGNNGVLDTMSGTLTTLQNMLNGTETAAKLEEILGDIEQARLAILGTASGEGTPATGIQAVIEAVEKVDGTVGDIWTEVQEMAGEGGTLDVIRTDLTSLLALFGDGENGSYTIQNVIDSITAAQNAIMGATETEGGKSVAEAFEELNTAISGIDVSAAVSEINTNVNSLIAALVTAGENNAFTKLAEELQSAIIGEDDVTLSSLAGDISGAQTAIEAAISGLAEELLGAYDESDGTYAGDGVLGDLSAALTAASNGIDGLSGELAEQAQSLTGNIAAAQTDITSIITMLATLGEEGDIATAVEDIVADLSELQTKVDSIASTVSASTAVEEAKNEALANIRTWLEGYIEEITGEASATGDAYAALSRGLGESGDYTPAAYTAETTDGELYAKLVQAFGESNARLVLKYYNEALAAIDGATTVSDVTTAEATFRAQVASVEASANNVPEAVDMTGIYVLLAIVLLLAIVACVAAILGLRRAPAPQGGAAQSAPAREEPAVQPEEKKAAEEAAQNTDEAEEPTEAEQLAESPAQDELAAEDGDKERIIIASNVRTFDEVFEALSDDKRALFNKVRDYALAKDGAAEFRQSNGVAVKRNGRQVVKLAIKRGTPVALFLLENEMLKDFRRSTNSQAKLKVRATELFIRDEDDLNTAYTMVDLSVSQIDRDIQATRERRKAARRARRMQRMAQESAPNEDEGQGDTPSGEGDK